MPSASKSFDEMPRGRRQFVMDPMENMKAQKAELIRIYEEKARIVRPDPNPEFVSFEEKLTGDPIKAAYHEKKFRMSPNKSAS